MKVPESPIMDEAAFLARGLADAKENAAQKKEEYEAARRVEQSWQVLIQEHTKKKKLAPPPKEDKRLDKWDLLDGFLKSKHVEGFTCPEIPKFLGQFNILVGKNFPYQAVQKWGDRVSLRDGRYYPMDRPVSNAADLPPRPAIQKNGVNLSSDLAEWVLQVYGPRLHLDRILEYMVAEGWEGSKNRRRDYKNMFANLSQQKHRFRNVGDNIWERVEGGEAESVKEGGRPVMVPRTLVS